MICRSSCLPGWGALPMKFVFACLLVFPVWAMGMDKSYDCAGKTRFVHRGAPSTVPADDRRSYRLKADRLEGLACELSETMIACMGLTPEQAMRKVVIDHAALSVSDTMELPTSLLIFEGQCVQTD